MTVESQTSPGGVSATATVSAELRQAADKLTAVPPCGCGHTDSDKEQWAALFLDLAAYADEDPAWPVSPIALDMARRINRAEVAK